MRFDSTEQRERMVERQVAARGIRDPDVIRAMREVPRDEFVPPALAEFAYDDTPLPIAADQTISQPYIVALMADALELEPGDKVLEIGTGSGYAAAVLARIAAQVFTVERHETLCTPARARFAELGIENVHVRCGDGTKGWLEEAPFDAIAVTAGGPAVPQSLAGGLPAIVRRQRRQDVEQLTFRSSAADHSTTTRFAQPRGLNTR